MKIVKYLIYAIFALFLMQAVAAANTGLVISYPNGTVKQGCVYVDDGSSAYSAISAAYGVDDVWTNNIISSLGAVANNATHAWYLWSNNGGSSFISKGKNYTTTTVSYGHVLGLAYTNDTNVGVPGYIGYDTLCPKKLSIKKFRVTADGSSADFNEDDINGVYAKGTIDDVKPNSTITIKIDFENLWDEKDEVEGEDEISIEDILVEGVIEEMDDGDDLEADDEADSIDIDAEEKGSVELVYHVPLAIADEKYELPLTITSQDTIGRHYDYEINLTVNVKKESHEMIFTKAQLSNSNVSCSRSDSVSYELVNIGKKDEDVTLTLTNSELGIAKTSTFEIKKYDGDADDAKKTDAISFVIPESAKAGSYILQLKAEYKDASETADLTLNVADCVKEVPKQKEPVQTTNTTQTVQQGTTNQDIQIIKPANIQPVDVVEEKTSFWEGDGMIVAMILVEVLVIGGIIALVFALRSKKY